MESKAHNSSRTYSQDLLASVVVFLVALPLCMGIAIASGAPPAAGLMTGIIGGLVVGTIQGSPLQVSGPAAGLTVIVWQLIQHHGLAALGVMVLLAGAIQAAAALVKGGRWFRAVPPSVIHGMLAGIGVLIFAGQFHVMVDDKPKSSGWLNLISIPMAVWKALFPEGNIHHQQAALVGVVSIATLLLWTRVPARLRLIPGPLVGVVVGTIVANVFGFSIAHVNVPSDLTASISLPTSASLQLLTNPAVWGTAMALAVVASAETLLCAGAVDRMHTGPRTNYNRELFAQGVGNMLCGLVGALPMTGVIVRSSANVQAGAKSRLSAFLHGVWILVLVVALPQVLRLVPVASLAAILVFTGYKLVNVKMMKELSKFGKSEVAIYAVTVVAIVATDLLKGVMVGLGLAIAKLLYRMSRMEIHLEDIPEQARAVLRLRGTATFFRLADIAETVDRVPPGRELHIHFDELDHVDHATLEFLTNWEKQHRTQGGSVVVDWHALEQRYHSHRGNHRKATPQVENEAMPKEGDPLAGAA
ncbi:SulP family inorganic anion transporter [Pendulispora brunnea]|uniref:SulP family inorganic anion transporter n=1 Tax=Pendulispora brunnea TaxID=2905690 RepID=A0ABZ2K234_9BACT